MMGHLAARGHELTSHPVQADVIVVNSCSFIDPAKKESVDTILEMAEYKRVGRAKRLVVAGCLVERYRGDITKDMPEVDALIGTNEIDRVVEVCEGIPANETTPDAGLYLYHDLTPRVLSTPRHYAYIKIAEGCDHPCTFCVIPQYRGKFLQPPLRIGGVGGHAALPAGRARDQSDSARTLPATAKTSVSKTGLRCCSHVSRRSKTPQPKWVRFLYAYPE